MIQTSKPKINEGAWLWLLKIIAGALILTLLAVHFVVNHLVAPQGLLNYADIVRYYQVPFVAIMEISFLVFVITHALLGVRSIILDLNPSASLNPFMNPILILLGCAGAAYGIWLVLVIVSRGSQGA